MKEISDAQNGTFFCFSVFLCHITIFDVGCGKENFDP